MRARVRRRRERADASSALFRRTFGSDVIRTRSRQRRSDDECFRTGASGWGVRCPHHGSAAGRDRDFVERVIADFGGEIFFSRMMMKPGKPTTFATIPRGADGEKTTLLVFALPGNPVSAAVTFTLIVAPALRALSGVKEPRLRRIRCELAETLRLDAERPEYHRATIVDWCGDTPSSLDRRQISSRLLSMRRETCSPSSHGTRRGGEGIDRERTCRVRSTTHRGCQRRKSARPSERATSKRVRATRRRAAAATQVNVFTNDEQCHRLKRVVGWRRPRRACRESGGDVVVDSMLRRRRRIRTARCTRS